MDTTLTKLKTKIGEHEFEAEGTTESVNEQFRAWRELVQLTDANPKCPSSVTSGNSLPRNGDAAVAPELEKIMKVEDRYVSLTVAVAGVHDAVLLLMYGQKVLRTNDAVTGAELLEGLSATGGYTVSRLDRILDKLALTGDVTSFGERRGKKYRLTNAGVTKARDLASAQVAAVA